MKRYAEPEDIAGIAAMLFEISYLTGKIIMAGGGLNLV